MAKAKGRRGKGEGSIYQRSDGRWVGQIENGYYPNGRRRYVRVVRRTEAEVIRAKRELENGANGRVLDGAMKLGDFLDAWIDHLVNEGGRDGRVLADNTVTAYRWAVGKVKAERIGNMRLRDIRPRDIEQWIGALRRRDLSPRSVSKAKTMLTSALGWAVLHDRIATNPAREVVVRQTSRGKLDDKLSRADVAKVLAKANDDAWGVAAVLALRLGLRIGEVCGLRWSDIDGKELRIRRTTTKTDDSAGTLPLLPEVADALAARRRHQASERLVCPPGLWTDSGYIVTGPRGGPVDPSAVRRWWNALLKSAGVAHRCGNCTDGARSPKCTSTVRRFHAARHTTATLLLDDGVPLEVVSAICRHSNINITANIYAEVTKDSMRRSLAKLA